MKVVSPPFMNVHEDCLACGNQLKYRFNLGKLRSLTVYLTACSDGRNKKAVTFKSEGIFAFLQNVLSVYRIHSAEENLLRAVSSAS